MNPVLQIELPYWIYRKLNDMAVALGKSPDEMAVNLLVELLQSAAPAEEPK